MRHFRLFLFLSLAQVSYSMISTYASAPMALSNCARDQTMTTFRPPLLAVEWLEDLGSHLSRRMGTTQPITELLENGDLKVYFRSATQSLPHETFEHPEGIGYPDSETADLALFFAQHYIIEMGHLLNKEEIEAIRLKVVQSPTDGTFKIRFEHLYRPKEYEFVPGRGAKLKRTLSTERLTN